MQPDVISEIALPAAETADLSIRATQAEMPVSEYLGIQCLLGAYGVLHPIVMAFNSRAKKGVSGTETNGAEES